MGATRAPARRGMISLYFCGTDRKGWFVNARTHTPRVLAWEPTCTQARVQAVLRFYRLFGWGMRQISGYIEDYRATRGLEAAVPGFAKLSDRFAALGPEITPRCEHVARWLARGKVVRPMLDSTGLRLGRVSVWHEVKCRHGPAHVPQRKMPRAIDAQMNIHSIRITTGAVSDSETMDALLPSAMPRDRRRRVLQR